MFACEIYGGQRADWQIHFKLWMAGCLLVRLVVYQASHIFGSSKDSTLNSWIASSTCFEILSTRILYFAEWKQTRDFSDYFCPANYSKENVCQCATTPPHYELTSVWRFWLYIKPRRAKKYFLHWGLQVSLVEHFDGREKRNPGGACSDGFSWLSGLLTKSFIGKARQKSKFLANNSATGIVNAKNCKSNVEKRIELSKENITHHTKFQNVISGSLSA